jgi:hypothetical protein
MANQNETRNKKMKAIKTKSLPRLISAVLTLLVVITALSGCGRGETAPSGGAGAPSVTAPPTRESLPAGDGSENAGADASPGDDLVIPISEISEKATFYPVEIDGTELEVLAVKAPDGTIRTAFNTCEVCYDSGRGYYEQDGSVLVCQNCGSRFQTSQVEVASQGCNPWPIVPENKTVDNETITIAYDFLKEATIIFQNWKGNYE